MMGQLNDDGEKLFYSFSLEEKVPVDHLLRRIDRFVEFDDLRRHLQPFYSSTGRPSVDPELMIRMLVIGYCYGIRSERRLCEEVDMNLAYRWFCRLGLEDTIPNHSTFSKNRHGRFRESNLFRALFEASVTRCMAEGLVKGEGFAIDGSIVAADANRQRAAPSDDDVDWSDPSISTRPVRDYLEAVDLQNAPKKSVSLTDPGARWTAASGGTAYFAWSTNYLIDVEQSVIVDVEPTTAYRSAEVDASRTMLDRTERTFGLKPKRFIGDTAYGSVDLVHWIVEDKQIEPHVSLWERPPRDGIFHHKEFVYDDETNSFMCPAGKVLKQYRRNFKVPRSEIPKSGIRNYRATKAECDTCAFKPKCCPGIAGRKVTRHIHETSRDVVRQIMKTVEYEQSRRDRKKVEMSFAHLKRIMKLDRLRLRGPTGAHDEFTLAAAVQNLRKLAVYATN
jgi:transposase